MSMTADIVERLKRIEQIIDEPGAVYLVAGEAAAEIERLRKEAWETFETNGDLGKMINEQMGKIKRLRDQLRVANSEAERFRQALQRADAEAEIERLRQSGNIKP